MIRLGDHVQDVEQGRAELTQRVREHCEHDGSPRGKVEGKGHSGRRTPSPGARLSHKLGPRSANCRGGCAGLNGAKGDGPAVAALLRTSARGRFTIIGSGWSRTSEACLPSDASGARPLGIAEPPGRRALCPLSYRPDDGPRLSGVSSTVVTHDTSRKLLRAAGGCTTSTRYRLLRWAIGVALPFPPIYPWAVSRSLLSWPGPLKVRQQRLSIPRTRGMGRGCVKLRAQIALIRIRALGGMSDE